MEKWWGEKKNYKDSMNKIRYMIGREKKSEKMKKTKQKNGKESLKILLDTFPSTTNHQQIYLYKDYFLFVC